MRQQRWEKRSEQLSGALWVLPLVFVVIALILGSTLSQITIRPGSPLGPFGDGTSRHRFRAEAVCPFPVIKQDDTSLDSRCGQLPRFPGTPVNTTLATRLRVSPLCTYLPSGRCTR